MIIEKISAYTSSCQYVFQGALSNKRGEIGS